ncbi:NDMA-dependent alcohol dehydrogenase [Gordonia humi]|uniref:alcohol dehydrogenase n=1 Tax=Gordonia humi TaxID=686429 RepID=A0A840EVL0_9ACTN|nr:NDMA-dependent alcohol dehydrogenase [Gordonia humi]MBB4133876.1 S-(hydroxymethyl)glutathione dehydrogenase/alcohol dehydrogenase [Gordonia humi]
MKIKAAVLEGPGHEWAVEEIDLLEPGPGEVRVANKFAGMCHSDAHLKHMGGMGTYPIVGGHEGSGIVEAVGDGVDRVQVGDHVVYSFIPSCGTCRYCATGRSYLCDWGANAGTGLMADGTYRFERNGEGVGGFCALGTFSERMVVSQRSLVKIDTSIPLDVAALLSCGVPTGWGAAVNAAEVAPGDVVVVFGAGGIGVNAVQGAAHAGASHIIVVDPVPFKREFALSVGATRATDDATQAARWAQELSAGTGADSVIVCSGVMDAATVGRAAGCAGKGATLAVVGLSDVPTDIAVALPVGLLAYNVLRIQGVLFGQCNPQSDIPLFLRLWAEGRLELDRLISHRYTLDQVNQGYVDQEAGTIIRGLIEFP